MAKLGTFCRVCLYVVKDSLYHSYSKTSRCPVILGNFTFYIGSNSPKFHWVVWFVSLFLNSSLINVITATDSGNDLKQSLGNTQLHFQYVSSFI